MDGGWTPTIYRQWKLDPKWEPERAKHSGRKIWDLQGANIYRPSQTEVKQNVTTVNQNNTNFFLRGKVSPGLKSWISDCRYFLTCTYTHKKTWTEQTVFSRKAFLVTPDDGILDGDSPSQILLQMWTYTPEEVNASEEQIKSSQRTQLKYPKPSEANVKSSKSSQRSRHARTSRAALLQFQTVSDLFQISLYTGGFKPQAVSKLFQTSLGCPQRSIPM